MSVDEREWSADSKALAACLEALLQLVRGQGDPAMPAAGHLRTDSAFRPAHSDSGEIARDAQGE